VKRKKAKKLDARKRREEAFLSKWGGGDSSLTGEKGGVVSGGRKGNNSKPMGERGKRARFNTFPDRKGLMSHRPHPREITELRKRQTNNH